ncbi:MAG: class I SAM-dependent methyltransferase [bacterium]|nr:class I SAM-dependent methyltransferase [bacterium]
MASKSVFDVYAHEYDLITNAKAREAYHAKEVGALIDRFDPTSVLDAGCASGLTSMLFAKQGIEAVGLDRSAKMIAVAQGKFKDQSLPLSFKRGSFEKLPKSLSGKFDLVVCLANSISGLGSFSDLKTAFRNFARVLEPGGNMVVQALNYEAIKEGEIFPIKATENKGIVYLRYARRRRRTQEIHVVRLDMNRKPFSFEPFCHEFDNFTVEEVSRAAETSGFTNLRKYGNLHLNKKFGKRSRDLVLTARKKV